MYKLVLLRHGESTWNLENRFTGWTDVDLTPTGVTQAQAAGQLLKAEGFGFDVAYTSVLKRAIHTLWHCLAGMDRPWGFLRIAATALLVGNLAVPAAWGVLWLLRHGYVHF